MRSVSQRIEVHREKVSSLSTNVVSFLRGKMEKTKKAKLLNQKRREKNGVNVCEG